MIDDLEYGAKEVVKEGFPNLSPTEFVDMFCKANKCQPETIVRRMEFEHIEFFSDNPCSRSI